METVIISPIQLSNNSHKAPSEFDEVYESWRNFVQVNKSFRELGRSSSSLSELEKTSVELVKVSTNEKSLFAS